MAYEWGQGERVAEGFRRIAGDELDRAVAGLRHPDDRGVEATVHDVRKRTKKVRGLARLVRPGLAPRDYRTVNRTARDAAAEISSIRDAHALLGSFDRLLVEGHDTGQGSADPALLAVRAELTRRAHEATRAVAEQHDRIGRALAGLEALRAFVAQCQVADHAGVLVEGATSAYRAGRKAMDRAADQGDDETLHEWRKREKELWYATRLLAPAAPAVLGAQAQVLHALSEDLGDDHDLAVLVDLLGVDPTAFGGEEAATATVERARRARRRLQRRAHGLGVQVYAEKPSAFGRRLRSHWKAWRREGHALPSGDR